MIKRLRRIWQALRHACGDDAYERYVVHMQSYHPGKPPLDRRAFYQAELERKWGKIRRCC